MERAGQQAHDRHVPSEGNRPQLGASGKGKAGDQFAGPGVSRLLAWVSWRPHHCPTTGYGRGFEAAGRITGYRFGDVQVAKARRRAERQAGRAARVGVTAYFIAFLSTAAATALLIVPSAYHRIQWRQRDKERMLRTSTNFTLVGLGFLTVAMASTIFVVPDVLYDTAWAVVMAVVAGLVFALCWFMLPTSRRLKNRS
jgi:Family of unknown function (DUF6328)